MFRPVLKRWGPSHLCAISCRARPPPRFLGALYRPGATRAGPTQHASLTCETIRRSVHSRAASPRIERHRPGTPDDDTIYALSSAQGRAGVAVVRLSGPDCLEVYRRLCPGKAIPKPRYAVVRALYEPMPEWARDVLDPGALILYFPGPKSVTGEDVLELHTHGGPATVRAVLSAIPRCARGGDGPEIRYAEPGEFTRRAFFSGRLDLAQVESLGDALDADTEQQRRAAVRGSSGALGRSYEAWRRSLLLARAEIEALIDFSEDQHFDESPRELLANVARLARETLRSIALHEAGGQRAELLRKGIRVALVGPPNAGKSSLMNLIVGREASIVSTEAGTTRDVVEASLDIRGYLCTFADTAGFRSAAAKPGGTQQNTQHGNMAAAPPGDGDGDKIGLVEQEGIRRARAKAEDSDVVIALASIEAAEALGPEDGAKTTTTHRVRYDEETLQLAAQAQQRIVVVNKRELVSTSELKGLIDKFRAQVLARFPGLHTAEPLVISCKECADASGDQLVGGRSRRHHNHDHAPGAHPLGKATVGLTATTTAAGAAAAGAAAAATATNQRADDYADPGPDPGSIQALVDGLARSFESLTCLPPDMQDLLGVTERQRQLLARCRGHLEDFLAEAAVGGLDGGAAPGPETRDCGGLEEPDVVLAAEHLRYAAATLAAITGRGDSGDVEEVLGVIFEKFCVGK